MVSEFIEMKKNYLGSNTHPGNKYQQFNKPRVSQSHSQLIVIGEKPQKILQSDIENSNRHRQSHKIDDQILQVQPSGGDSSYVMDVQHQNIPSSRVLISNVQIDSKNKQQNQFQTPIPNQTQQETILKQTTLNFETSKQVRPQSQQHQMPKQISSKDKYEKKTTQSIYQIQMDQIEQFQSRNDQGDQTLTQNQGKIFQLLNQNKFQPFQIDVNSQMNPNTAGAIGMDGIIRINKNKTVSENGDAFTQMQINNITNRKLNSLKSQIQNHQMAQMSAASSIQRVTHQNILDLQKKSYDISSKSIVVGTQDGNNINLYNQQDNLQYLDIYGKNDFQYQANSRLDIGTEPQSSISYQMPLEASKTINKNKDQEDSRMLSQKEELSHENKEKTRVYSKNQRSFTATSKSIKDKLNEQNFLVEIGMASNSDLAKDNAKKDIFQNGGAQFQNETIQDSVKSQNAQEVQYINNQYYNNIIQKSHKNNDSTVENYQRIILNPLQTNFQALQSQILSDVQINGVSISQKLNQKKEKAYGIEQSAKFKKNRKLVQNEGLKPQRKDRYGSAMMVQHQTTYLQQAQSLARYRNLFDPLLQKNNQKLQFDNLYMVQGNSFKLIQKQKVQTNQSVLREDSKMIGTTLPNESGSYQNIVKNNQQMNNHITENTFQNIDTVNAAEADTDNVTRVHESRYSAFSRIGSNLHNYNIQQDQKFPNNQYLNHLQSTRDLNLYPNNLKRDSSQSNIQKSKQFENQHQPNNDQIHYQIENIIQNELKIEKFNQTTNMDFQSAFQQKEITENNSVSGAKTYNPLNKFQPIKGVQIMLNQNNYSGKTTPKIQMGAERISGSHNSSTRKIFKGSKPLSSEQTARPQDSSPTKEKFQEPKKIDIEFDANFNYFHLQQNVEIIKNVKLSKEQRKKKNNSQLRTLLSLQNVQQSQKQPSLKNAMWGNEDQSAKQIYEAQSTPFLKKQTTQLGISDSNFNNTGEQNKKTNSTQMKSQQDLSSNIFMQRSYYNNKADLSTGIQINDVNQSYEVLTAQEQEFKKKVKKNDQNALNKKWMTKFFRKREQIQSASANQTKKKKKNTSILNNLLKQEKEKTNQTEAQKFIQTENSFDKNENNQLNMISFNEIQQIDNSLKKSEQNEVPQSVIINNIVSKEIILTAKKEIQVEYKKESQDQNQLKRDLSSPYNLSKQKAIQNYKMIQKINEQQENVQQEVIKQEEQKEIEKIVQILQKQNIIKKKKDDKDIKQNEKAKQSLTEIKSQQITRKMYQQERENELLNQINMYQNIQQFNIESQQKILQFDEIKLRQVQHKNETQIDLNVSNKEDKNKSFNHNNITSTPQKLNKTSIINQSSENFKGSTDLSILKSQIIQKSKKSNQLERKLTIYQKQEIEFQKVYKQKIEELRSLPDGLFDQQKKLSNLNKSVENQTELSKVNDQTVNDQANDLQINKEYNIDFSKDFSLKDYNIYQERNLEQNILSTRMITLEKYLKQSLHGRQFLHKDQVFNIDPIRQKIRVIPQNRVPLQQGISPEYYFIQSTKHCLRNNLPLALQSLHKGFQINPNNLYCRLTHGVIMFKLGLFSQAKHDFQIVVSMHPKEPFCHYNYALTLLQMGELNEALKAVDVITNKKSEIQKADFELLQDANVLQAICLWRTNCPLEAVKCLNVAQRFKAKLKEKNVAKQLTSKQLQDILNDYTMKEIKQDILQDKYIYDSVRSQSQNVQTHYSKFLENREFSFNQAQSNFIIKDNQGIKKLRRKQQNKKSKMEDEHIDIILGYEQSIRQQSAGPAEFQKLFGNSFQDVRDSLKIQEGFPKIFKKQLSNTTQQLKFKLEQNLSRTQIQSYENITFQKIQNQQNQILISNQNNDENSSNNPIKEFPAQIQKQFNDLKTEFIQTHKQADKNQKSKEDKLKEIIFEQKLEQFYNLLRDYQVKLIDDGEKVSIEKIKEQFLKKLYDTNSTEGGRLKDYKNIDLQNSHVSMQYIDQSAATEQVQNQSQATRNINQLVDSKLQNKLIEGSVFTKNGIVEINKDQRQLEIMMNELQNKFKNISEDFFNELDRDDHKIFQRELKEEDITEYKNVAIGKNAQQKQETSQRDQMMYGNDKILKKLRENLQTENNLPFDLCNILKADIEEKGKQRQIEMQSQKNQQKRIENRKLMMIKHEFHKYKGKNRHVQILDLIIGNLKFFQRFNEDQRKSVYENAEYVTFPARTVIFRQGDMGDKMYVILKGRVAVEKKTKETGNLPLVIAILEDGQHFGELSLIDQEKVVNNTKKSHILDHLAFEEQPKFQGRKASCITTEQTDLLILNQDLSVKLYQPTNQQELSTHSDKFIIQDKESENTEMKNDELSRKIRILQKIPYFNDVDPKNLMPIAANIVPRTYSFGEFLVKRGEVPQGLFIIIKGQCKVVATRFGVRRLVSKQNQSNDIQNQKKNYKKLGIVDRTINQFNPETSILNQVKTNHRAYQNERVMVDEKGNEIKDRIEYQDFMAFSQLTQGNAFGGRILIPFEHFQSIQRICFGMNAMDRYYPIGCNREEIDSENEEFYHMKSLLSIVADSAKVDVWIIEKQDMNYLQDKDLKLIYEKIVRMKEEDRPYHEQDINFIIDQFQKWDKYKIDCIEALFDRKIMEKWFKGKS